MKKSSQAVLYRRPAFLLRLISHVLICLQLSLPFTNNIFAALAAVPTPTTVKSESRLEAEPSRGEAFVKPNWAQGEAEIRSARIFVMPLVPTGPTSIEENVALQAALEQFKKRTAQDDASSLLAFIEKHLESPWKGALQFNLGLLFRRTGHFTKALPAWESAWNLTKSSTDPRVKAVADWAVGELAEINARLGRFERLNPLFAEITGRDIRGSASQKVAGAREGLWLMDNRPEEAFKCGPYALDNILAFQTSTRVGNRLIEEARSTRNGTSLYDVWQLAEKVGLDYQPAVRPVGAKIVTPSVVNWKVGHYAALVKEVNGGYLVKDPTFGDDLWVSASTLDEEASGYFLIPADSLPSGWRVATVEESKLVFGKGSTTGSDPKRYKSTDIKAGGDLCGGTGGMARYSFHALLVSLNIMDTPVGYQPPRGKPIQFTATYNQRESYQQSPYTYSNLGNQWNYNWLSYIEESTNAVSATCYLPGGGVETYSNFDTNTQSYATDVSSRVKLVKTGASTYERRLPDGGKQVYTVSDGASPNNVYISQDIDPSTNSIAFHYDAAMRLTHVVDPLGQTNTLSYSLASDTNKVTRVTDPFGRYASFEYNTNGQLTKITDTIGLTSQFGYSTNDFIDTLITPYGMTTFEQGEFGSAGGRRKWIISTDPTGQKERVEYRDDSGASPEPQPPGVGNGNYVQYRNTFFFDKKSYQQYGTNDYSKAYVYQWLKTGAGPSATGALDSQKAAMEGRIYYNTPGATSPYLGTNEMPSAVGRVLDGGSNQISYFSYNDLGKVTMSVDPANRTNIFVYATNQIDLLKAIVGNSTNNPVLAEFAYNSQHLPTRAINLSRQTNFFGYNAYGQLTAMTNAKNEKISLAYDSKGYLTNVTGSIPGMTSSFIYDGYGRVQSVTDAEGYVVSTEYDAMDRPTKITHPDGTYEQIVYKWLDPILFRDRRGHWTQKVYDPLRRVKEIQDSLGRITRFDWCNCGSLDSMTDPMGRVTSWTRDLQGRVTAKVYPNTTTNYFIYETNSSRLWMTVDAKNQTNIYSYYIDNNLKSVVYTNAAVATPTVSYTYDTTNLNRLLTMVDGTGTNTYTYHSLTGAGNFGLGQLASVNGPLTNDTVSFDYDRLGRVTNRTINAAGTRLFYDAAGRVMRLTNVLGSFTNSYVTNTTRLSSIRASTGKKTTFNYYGATNDFRLQQILHSNSTVQLSSFSYTYDADGQIATWTQQTNTATPKVLQLEYDPVDQLIGATVRSNSVAGAILKRYAYGYDAAGNRTAEQIDLKPDSAGYNTANQLTNTTGTGTVRFKGSLNKPGTVTVGTNTALMSQTTNFTGLADVTLGTNVITVKATDYYAHIRTNQFQLIVTNQAVAKTLDYDANGNLTNAVTATTTNSYLWDAADRLVRITKLTNAITYVSEFTYDGLGRRTQIIERTNGVAVSTNKFLWVGMELCEQRNNTGATVTKRFFDQGEQISGTNYYFTTDHLGSIREMTTAAGVIAARYDYDPYGRRTKISGSIDADFAFTGHYYHAPSGLHLAPYRAYDAETGRWISRDPIEEEGGVNLYAYVGNDPVNMVDPLGLAPWKKAIQVYEAAKKEYKLVANVKEKSGTKATDAIKGALDSIDTSKGTKRVVETSDDAASKWLAGELGNGKLRKKESSPGYPEGYHPTGGNYGDVHIQTRRAGKGAGIKYLSILAGILIPQALRASNDPCNSAFDVGVAGAWDIASTLDPIFLTDALEWIFKVRPEDY